MKFQCQVDIDLPRSKVIELFDNPDNMQFGKMALYLSRTKMGSMENQVQPQL